MKESAVLFGDQKSLVGIVSDPEGESNGLGLIFMNAGFTHHVGPQRMYVRFARRAAEMGFTSLRFDNSGIGDSPRRADNLPFPDSVIKDANDAMNFLQSTRGIEKCVLTGVCWGADNSVRVCSVDPRAVAVAAVDFYAVPSLRHLLRVYPKRLLAPQSWGNLFRGDSSIFERTKGVVMGALKLKKQETAGDVLPSLPPPVVLEKLSEMIDRGVHLCFAYASGAVSYDQYVSRFRRRMRELEKSGRLDIKVFPAADHLFTFRYNQARLWEFLEAWLAKVASEVGTGSGSTQPHVLSAD